ncbi:MAG: tRNA (adenosine(37)-N6)-dimethylallyltransferase MiaA [Deltaproteobacteria bacterium]|nr:tRNA (adenosine(37)-N6)-dimethylallyltransferase MiaA [Deltaproteobacteria bacterium]
MAARPRIVVLLGPTASGKTRLGMALAQELGVPIISADSVQVYRGLDIGSAKPTPAERARVPHVGLDLLDPTEPSHAGRWLAAIEPTIASLHDAGKVPLVAGGTGLYARVLLLGLAPIPEIDPALRDEVRRRVAADPRAAHAELARRDPLTAARLAERDQQRVARALEVALHTGRPLSAWHADEPQAPRFDATIVVLDPAPAALEARIAARAEAMVQAGLVAEVAALLAGGIPPDAPGLATLGYREVVAALVAGRPLDGDLLVRAHRQYARRQRTWLRGSGMAGLPATRLDPDDHDALARLFALAVAHP